MPKKTVLEYVQGALTIMGSDQVDSIADTQESMDVAHLLRTVYDELMERQEKGWSFLKRFVPLVAGADVARPTLLTLPDNVRFLHTLWYNSSTETGVTRNRELIYMEPDDFLRTRGVYAADRQLVTTPEGVSFYVDTKRMPAVFTSFNDKDLYCDAFDSSIESTLTSSRASARVTIIPELIVADDHIPDLPEHMVPLLQHTLNAAASLTFRQQPSAPDENRARRQLAGKRRTESRLTRENYYARQYGRK